VTTFITAPHQQPTDAAGVAHSPETERTSLVQQLNELDTSFGARLADYSSNAARISMATGAIGGAGAFVAIRHHHGQTYNAAKDFAEHAATRVNNHLAQPAALGFDALRMTIEEDIRRMLMATGRRAEPTVKAVEHLFEMTALHGKDSSLARRAEEALSHEASSLLRNIFTRSPVGGAVSIVGSAIAAGVAGHEIFKATHPQQRLEIMQLARECRRLESLTKPDSAITPAGSVSERLNDKTPLQNGPAKSA
jgi:hypothetical protein